MDMVTTRTGDLGETGLFAGERQKKTQPVFDCLGDLDELSSSLGLLRVLTGPEPVEFLQEDLIKWGALVASLPTSEDYPSDLFESWNFPGRLKALELRAQQLRDQTPIPRHFILPGEKGVEAGARADMARAISRRAERTIQAYRQDENREDLLPLTIYLNRVSDYLFILARNLEKDA